MSILSSLRFSDRMRFARVSKACYHLAFQNIDEKFDKEDANTEKAKKALEFSNSNKDLNKAGSFIALKIPSPDPDIQSWLDEPQRYEHQAYLHQSNHYQNKRNYFEQQEKSKLSSSPLDYFLQVCQQEFRGKSEQDLSQNKTYQLQLSFLEQFLRDWYKVKEKSSQGELKIESKAQFNHSLNEILDYWGPLPPIEPNQSWKEKVKEEMCANPLYKLLDLALLPGFMEYQSPDQTKQILRKKPEGTYLIKMDEKSHFTYRYPLRLQIKKNL